MNRWMPRNMHKEATICLGILSLSFAAVFGYLIMANSPAKIHQMASSQIPTMAIVPPKIRTNKIELVNGGVMIYDPKAHFVFDDEFNPKLTQGNFLLTLNGPLKIIFHEKEALIDSQNAEVQIFMAKDLDPKIKLISGEATLMLVGSNKPIELSATDFYELGAAPTSFTRQPEGKRKKKSRQRAAATSTAAL